MGGVAIAFSGVGFSEALFYCVTFYINAIKMSERCYLDDCMTP